MNTTPYAVPTALTHLWRSPSRLLEPGDGVIIIHPDGTRQHGTIEDAVTRTNSGYLIQTAGGQQTTVPIEWEHK